MANNKAREDNTIYTASFTLEQDGIRGPITPKLKLDPLVNPNDTEVPAVYEYMSTVAMSFLRQVRAVDDNNEVLDESEWDRVSLDVMADETGGIKH